jgi:hypothetical protein
MRKSKALQNAARRKQRALIKLFGKIDYDPEYDYKRARAGIARDCAERGKTLS